MKSTWIIRLEIKQKYIHGLRYKHKERGRESRGVVKVSILDAIIPAELIEGC